MRMLAHTSGNAKTALRPNAAAEASLSTASSDEAPASELLSQSASSQIIHRRTSECVVPLCAQATTVYDVHLRIHTRCLTILGFIQLKMYIIQIIPVQPHAHACLHTAGNTSTTDDSQNLEPPISECVVP